MMTRYSCPNNSNPADRVNFFYWDDMIEYLRNELEADGNTYRMAISNWTQASRKQRDEGKASCQLVWVRINPETRMAETVSRTVTCEDVSILPGAERITPRGIKVVDWYKAEW